MITMLRIAINEAHHAQSGKGFYLPESASSTCCRLATGRSAICHMISCLPQPNAKTVLLPAYIAEGVIRPFLNAGFEILFYRLEKDLRPVINDIDRLLERINGLSVTVLIHYFGFSSRSAELSEILGKHNTVVFDDLAHAPFTMDSSGKLLAEEAELALYSLNKFLPVIDGAILSSKRADMGVAFNESKLSELPVTTQHAYSRHLHAGYDLFKSKDPVQCRQNLEILEAAYEEYYSVINAEIIPFRQSTESSQIEEKFPYNGLIKRRKLNSSLLYETLRSATFTLLHPVLPDEVVPWCIPATVPAYKRVEVLNRLFDQGVLLSVLEDKWDFIPEEKSNMFSVEQAFINEHVLIPVSEFISTDAMSDMIDKLNAI